MKNTSSAPSVVVPSKRRQRRRGQKCGSHESPRSRMWRKKEYLTTAYRMAVISSIAYWDMEKKPMVDFNVTGFRLQDDDQRGRTWLTRTLRTRLCQGHGGLQALRCERLRYMHLFHPHLRSDGPTTTTQSSSCRDKMIAKEEEGKFYQFNYWFRDWHEPTKVPTVKWHDTDLLVSTSGDNILVVSFTGTQSKADHLTNVQTFEPASHSGMFGTTIHGSLHRGMLNAYSRVQRGSVVRLCKDRCFAGAMEGTLHRRYEKCLKEQEKTKKSKRNKTANTTLPPEDRNVMSSGEQDNITTRAGEDKDTNGSQKANPKEIGCRLKGEKLMVILRELVSEALLEGRVVHLTGHSLGGALTTMLALDIIINLPDVPISKLHVWTFGAPEVADEVFIRSAIEASPRLGAFLREKSGRFHRFVTLTDDCKADFVANVASRALPSHHKRTLGGRVARRLGGVKGNISHVATPHYLLPPRRLDESSRNATDKDAALIRSTISAHQTTNYLQGLSREWKYHLRSDLPREISEWIGEPISV